jgi:hypothetical protein
MEGATGKTTFFVAYLKKCYLEMAGGQTGRTDGQPAAAISVVQHWDVVVIVVVVVNPSFSQAAMSMGRTDGRRTIKCIQSYG